MRREERVTVQGPVKKQQPDGMSHTGGGGLWPLGAWVTSVSGNLAQGAQCPAPLGGGLGRWVGFRPVHSQHRHKKGGCEGNVPSPVLHVKSIFKSCLPKSFVPVVPWLVRGMPCVSI